MEPTTVTTMVLIIFAVCLITMTTGCTSGPGSRRPPRAEQPSEPEIEAAVLKMRRDRGLRAAPPPALTALEHSSGNPSTSG